MAKEPRTTIPLSKATRDRLAGFCGKGYKQDRGARSYDEAILALLDLVHDIEDLVTSLQAVEDATVSAAALLAAYKKATEGIDDRGGE